MRITNRQAFRSSAGSHSITFNLPGSFGFFAPEKSKSLETQYLK
jgi:hypothetical protein